MVSLFFSILFETEQTNADGQDFSSFSLSLTSLKKSPMARPTYSDLLKHPFLVADAARTDVDMVKWVAEALARRAEKGVPLAPLVPGTN